MISTNIALMDILGVDHKNKHITEVTLILTPAELPRLTVVERIVGDELLEDVTQEFTLEAVTPTEEPLPPLPSAIHCQFCHEQMYDNTDKCKACGYVQQHG